MKILFKFSNEKDGFIEMSLGQKLRTFEGKTENYWIQICGGSGFCLIIVFKDRVEIERFIHGEVMEVE